MKVFGVVSTAALFLFLGIASSALAQEEHHEQDAKPEKQEQQPKPSQHEQQAKAPQQQRQAEPVTQKQPQANKQPVQQHQQAAKTSNRPAQPQPTPIRQGQSQANKQPVQQHQQVARTASRPQQPQARTQQRPQRSIAEVQRQHSAPALRLSARTQSRIPDDRFRSNFGRDHRFAIGSPTLVGGYSRFQYGGFWFGFVQPWPAEWYYTDDVYVDFVDGGYYLYNPYYPGERVSISVVI